MAFSPLIASAGIYDSSSQNIDGTADSISVEMNLGMLAGVPIFVPVTWQGAATATVTDSAGNAYVQLAAVAAGTASNSSALFQCVSGIPPADGSVLEITVQTSVPVSHLFAAPFLPFVPKFPMVNNPPGVQTHPFASGTTGAPSIVTTLPDAYDTVIAIVYGAGTAAVETSGWTLLESNPQGAALLMTTPASAGSFTAQPCTYSGTPAISMILFSMPPTQNVGMVQDNNGKFLPQGLTELRPFGDTISSLQSASGWSLPFCCGETIRLQWNLLQPNPPTGVAAVDFDFSYIDAALALAEQNGMFINIILGAGDMTPSWIVERIPMFNSTFTGQSPFPYPWNSVYQSYLQQLITQLSRYDGHPCLADIAIGGFGWQDAMSFCRSDDDNTLLNSVSLGGISGIDLLFSAFQKICLMYAYAFRKTRLSVTFFSPIYPNNVANEQIALGWIRWLFGLGSQFGIQYHNYDPVITPTQGAIPSAAIFNYSRTNSGFAQPQHASPTDWTTGIYKLVALTQARCCETYIGQLESDPGGPSGFNSQLAVVMLQFVAKNWKSFSPVPIPPAPAPPIPAPTGAPGTPPGYTIAKVVQSIGGDLWDTISKRVYGTERFCNVLMGANPSLAGYVQLPPNSSVAIPFITVPPPSSSQRWSNLY